MNNKKNQIVAIITAGGSGKRLKSKTKKQFLEIAGRPLISWVIEPFYLHPMIDKIIISLPEDEMNTVPKRISKEFPKAKISFSAGGKERQDSVYNALMLCPEDTGYVLIHDGVRPFISQNDITVLCETVKKKKAVIPITNIKNTIKEISNKKIIKTIPRENLAEALTPQAFEYELIKSCHKKAKQENLYFTDDAAILEHYGFSVHTIEHSSINFKITDSFDLKIAKIIISNNDEFRIR